jgi:hypothetical protein
MKRNNPISLHSVAAECCNKSLVPKWCFSFSFFNICEHDVIFFSFIFCLLSVMYMYL